MAGLLDLIAERQKTLSAARPNSIAGLLAETGARPGENLASMAQQYISTLPQKTQANLAYQMSLLDKAYPGNTYQSMMTQGDPKALAELAMQAPYNAMIAYHGTPHNILGKFDISKVGTGEGAQAYGHGMYFAENPNVAKEYQKMVTGAEQTAAEYLKMYKTPESAIAVLEGGLKPNLTPEAKKFTQDAIDVLKSGKELKGNLYKVDIPDEYIPNMLDWDKPFKEQPKEVQKALKNMANQYGSHLKSVIKDNDTGEVIYKHMGNYKRNVEKAGANPDVLVSQHLNEFGIKGIKYPDAGSRTTEGGTSNFVVFDPSEVKILEKNSKKVEGLLSE